MELYLVFIIVFGLVMLLGGVAAWSYYKFDDDNKKRTGQSNADLNMAPGFHSSYGCAQGCSNNP